ncbi:phosphoethanolamine transferase [Helicobacter pylori]|uniref:phosphoethanolamine transferase n=1 Tax=Helicobacter pylori TaxID=210 RepID=UPI0012E77B76|nr:sulfatase-like hydrolase/transferase [Helicobacter pylori]MUU63458.1 phosphoethanolamine transferase [Helicobacter pylori]WQV74657.1 sulfatase-like hydrolase/transferase [Helicobacter pylori]
MEKLLKFLKFFANSVTLDEKFLIFLLCNALSNAYKNSDLFSFSKGFLGAFLIGFVVYYGCALIPKKRLRYSLEWLFIGSGIIFSVAEIFTLFMFKMPFSKGLIDTLLATNSSETMAFIKSYKNYLLYYALILIALLIMIKIIRFRALVPGVIAGVLGLSILTIGSVRNVKPLTNNDAILKRSLFSLSLTRGFYSAYLSLTDRQQAIKFYSFLNSLYLPSDYLSSTGDVPNVVLVIGESASRNFMQLYGYSVPNNPLLSELANERERESSNLFVFSDTISKEGSTSDVFESLLNYSDAETNKPWYHYHNMIDIFKRSHYETFWLEEQIVDEWGIIQNLVSNRSKNRYLLQRDRNLYFLPGEWTGYDEDILTFYSKNIPSQLKSKNFIVFHLRGSHKTYSERFPKNFAKFKPSDLSFSNLHVSNDRDKQIVSDYVNSLYYNDAVLNGIFNLFKNKDAIVFYLSDHAQDIFESGPTYGHSCSKAGLEIPFMIYVSDIFKEKHPEKVKLIKNALNKPFMSDDLIHSLLPLVGIRTKDEIESKNLFSPQFDAQRKRAVCYGNMDYDKVAK